MLPERFATTTRRATTTVRHKVLFSVLCYPPSFTALSLWGWFSFVSFHFSSSESVSIIKFFAQTVRGLNDTAEKGQKWQALKEGERGTGNGSVAGLQDMKIKLNFRFLRLRFWACPGKRQWQILLITQRVQLQQRGGGGGQPVCWGWLATHTYICRWRDVGGDLTKIQNTKRVSSVAKKAKHVAVPSPSLSLPLTLSCLPFAVQIYFSFTIILLDEQAFLFWQLAQASVCAASPFCLQQMWFSSCILPRDTGKTIKREICGRIKLKFNKNIIYWRKRCENEGERSENRIVLRLGVVNYGSGNIKPKFDDLLSVGVL